MLRARGATAARHRWRWAAYHTLEHTALHVGHMQLTRQFYDDGVGGTARRRTGTPSADPDA